MRRIATVLLAGGLLLTLAGPAAARQPGPNIVQTAIAVNASTGEFDHLIAEVVRAGLVDTLSANRPTDAAFEQLFDTLGVDGVNDIPVPVLTAVLLHHVAPGERFSGDVLDSSRVRMLDKSFTHPGLRGGVPTIDGATIVIPDVDVSNGVIHVIDAVLLP